MPKRPPSIWGDDERAEVGLEARRTPAHGVAIPIEVSDELTPPPAEPPDITQLPGFDELAPEIREPMLALHNSQRVLDVAVAKIWGARKARDEIADLREAVDKIGTYLGPVSEMLSGWRSQAGLLQRIALRMEEQGKRADRLDRLFESQDKRVDTVERESTGFNATLMAFGQRIEASVTTLVRSIEAVSQRAEALDVRLREVEKSSATEDDLKATRGEIKVLEHTLGTRVASLEETRTRQRGAMWVLGGLMSAAAAVGGFLLHELWTWLRGK